MIQILLGQTAHSTFRLEKYKQILVRKIPGFSWDTVKVHSRFVYILKAQETFTDLQKKQLHELLAIDSHEMPVDFFVTPRIGTISPWSSKATDILINCGLTTITRVERAVAFFIEVNSTQKTIMLNEIADNLHDPLTQSVLYQKNQLEKIFEHIAPQPLQEIPLLTVGIAALEKANVELALALSAQEMDYLFREYQRLQRNPTDTELMMFAQANSEHCRHKIFNAKWVVDDIEQPRSLFAMIKNTYQQHNAGVLSAYKDNAAVIAGPSVQRFFAKPNGEYHYQQEPVHTVLKVETHNHPTAIAPFPGAATGAGGEIRDEGATGRGAYPKAGMCGFSVSHLYVPDFFQPWENTFMKPQRIASALDIMLEGPIGAAAFNNEFGRPNLCGYFRNFEMQDQENTWRGYHKPIMIAGGMGNIRDEHVIKQPLPNGTALIVLGGPALRIGLGGGAASSLSSGQSSSELDFASVQRDNPEMQRRCQEVINRCWALGEKNPILSIHDVGAGGLANALPELVHDADQGGLFNLRKIPSLESSMSPLEIWCNEAQERYVLGVSQHNLAEFMAICHREKCPVAEVGVVTEEKQLTVHDDYFHTHPVNIPMNLLFGNTPRQRREFSRQSFIGNQSNEESIVATLGNDWQDLAKRVLTFPAVASKQFLITIGDRSVTGLVVRDQMVGPWQVPVADVAVTAASFNDVVGEAMAVGERAPLALLNSAASARMAVAEAITNIAAATITQLSAIKLSANWMAAPNHGHENQALYDAVYALGMELCPALQLTIPVGKDSLSMKTQWRDENSTYEVVSPLSVIITAVAPVIDIRKTATPQLQWSEGSELWLIDLGAKKNRLGGSILLQSFQEIGGESPDVDEPQKLAAFFNAIQELHTANLLLAYHDRSDGGLFATLCEMAFAGNCGITLQVDKLIQEEKQLIPAFFNEELGAVMQIRLQDAETIKNIFAKHGLSELLIPLGQPCINSKKLSIKQGEKILQEFDLQQLFNAWNKTSYQLQRLRDNPDCADAEYHAMCSQFSQPGIHQAVRLSFDINQDITAPFLNLTRPKIAILREQGVNGHIEMAAAFDRAKFSAVDVHMTDLLNGRVDLKNFKGLAVCGGFSYGDVLGAGGGWAKSILFNEMLREQFQQFFHRQDTFTLGVCNGCQMLSQLKSLIPGAEAWPRFVRNLSEQFEARFSLVEIQSSPSILLQDMAGSRIPITVAHGEGRVEFSSLTSKEKLLQDNLVSLRFIDTSGQLTENYPANPNGSCEGMTGFTTLDGRVTIMMPHPERVFRTVQHSWHPSEWQEDGPWLRLFRNARCWVN